MTVVEQVWGTANEKIHTVGTVCLGFSAVAFMVLRTEIKAQALVIFISFALGVTLVGVATIRNSWRRWRTGEDTLVLLRRRDSSGPVLSTAVHVFGRRVEWTGRVAHVDVGRFSIRPIRETDALAAGTRLSRGYQLFRAVYWMACSSLLFQTVFGLGAVAYGLWLLRFLVQFSQSKV